MSSLVHRTSSEKQAGPLPSKEAGTDVSAGSDIVIHAAEPWGDDHTQRKLRPRHIQLIGIAGTIGTA
jgi:amino acid transporter